MMEVQSVYSTSIKNDRSIIACLLVSRGKYVTDEKFVIDTGAKYTCCRYTVVDKTLEEKKLRNFSDFRLIGGMVEGEYLKFYKYHLNQFTIGNVDMGEQDIWIIFDDRITDIILGMDIPKQIIMVVNPYHQKIQFCKDVCDYEENFHLKVV